ncbi:hypothetical protein BU16DRAFT_566978 [Lophium mytilinum]|uniref:Solute carrier family 40 member n=1 Tax=Lophium mytilinum TaxID=390894 RepID=A0A6A6QD01_9PEZI|nr:hypothetical protein BU16DRAFT_566978 [Lophium mytilinum]
MPDRPSAEIAHDGTPELSRKQGYILYLCHLLSAWNARSYEFAAILFTAAAYPGGLRATSFVGITISLAAILFASAVGKWIDHAPSRLRTLLATIIINRSTIIVSCFAWFLIVGGPSTKLHGRSSPLDQDSSFELRGAPKHIVFAFGLGLGVIETLSRKANVISMERDWVPVLAPETGAIHFTLTQVNATMARIDMICKVLAPIAVSGFLSIVPSIRYGVVGIASTNILSLWLEFWTARWLWSQCHTLREPKLPAILEFDSNGDLLSHAYPSQGRNTFLAVWIESVQAWWHGYIPSLRLFFSTEVWIPTIAMCTTHASVLSVSGSLIVFLLNSGYSMKVVTVAETASAIFEVGSTFVGPYAVRKLSPMASPASHVLLTVSAKDDSSTSSDDEEDVESDGDPDDPLNHHNTGPDINTGITRLGLWGILSMALTLTPTVPLFAYLIHTLTYPIPPSSDSPSLTSHLPLSLFLLLLLSASRLGRGLLQLSTQQLAQARVPAHQRSSFAGTEIAFVSVFGLSHNIGTAIWSAPAQFGWLAGWSAVAVGTAAGAFGWWVRMERKGGRVRL